MKAPADLSVSLESGDNLTQVEFHRRYLMRPDINRAELVEGVVWVGGRVTADHGASHAMLAGWIGHYIAQHAGPDSAIHITTILDDRNEVQPDVVVWWPKPGGPQVNKDGFIVGPPQLIAEVANSSASYELHSKKEAYRRHKVREYVVWRILDEAIDWFDLRNGAYVRRETGPDGIIESSQFSGLRLHVPSMLALDRAGIIAPLQAPRERASGLGEG